MLPFDIQLVDPALVGCDAHDSAGFIPWYFASLCNTLTRVLYVLHVMQAFNADSRKHSVQYPDTFEEELDLAVVPWQHKDAEAPAAPAPTAAAAAAAEPAAAAAEPVAAAAEPAAAAAAGPAAAAADAAAKQQQPAAGAAEQEGAAGTTSDEAAGPGRAIKKIKITMKSSGPLPAGAAAEATKTDPLSPTDGTGRPRRQAAMTTPAAAAGGSGGGATGTSSKQGAKDSAEKGSADRIKSPVLGSAEKAQRAADAQVGARIKILWPKDKTMYSGEIIVSDAWLSYGWDVLCCIDCADSLWFGKAVAGYFAAACCKAACMTSIGRLRLSPECGSLPACTLPSWLHCKNSHARFDQLALLSAVAMLHHLQAYNKKDHKHTIKYDEDGQREHINLINTARKWELDTSPPAPKKAPADDTEQQKEPAKKTPAAAGGAAGGAKPRKSSGGGAAAAGKEEAKPTGTRLAGQMIEMYQTDKQAYVKGTVQVCAQRHSAAWPC